MPSWTDYRNTARSRGALAFELYVVESRLTAAPEDMLEVLPAHLAYQKEMEAAGHLFLAGPLSDDSGENTSGGGLIIYRAASMAEAKELADNDPMHQNGMRAYSLRRWLINEGSLTFSFGLSDQSVTVR